MSDPKRAAVRLPKIRGTQIGLDPAKVAQIRADMMAGRFAYQEVRAWATGVIDPKGVYHVFVGHHRMAAAMEIYKETGDATAVRELLRWGKWVTITYTPIHSRPLPARDWWGWIRNRLRF